MVYDALNILNLFVGYLAYKINVDNTFGNFWNKILEKIVYYSPVNFSRLFDKYKISAKHNWGELVYHMAVCNRTNRYWQFDVEFS